MPATGFENIPAIEFISPFESRLPSVSTCALLIFFPRNLGLQSYENFEEKMDMAILNSFGFGCA